MLVRSARLDDAENLSVLAIQVWLHNYATEGITSTISKYVLAEFSAERFISLLSEESSKVFVAESSKNLVGYVVLVLGAVCPEATTAKAELATLYVQEPFVSKGVGSQLLTTAESWALSQASSPLWLTVNSKNKRAIAFYAKHGYCKIGVTYFRLGAENHENFVLSHSAA